MTIDEIHEVLTAYEMRTGINEISRKEATFTVSSKNQLENLYDEEALFIKKLEKGTRKYKGKLPLKCFNCGRIGHFSSKCHYPKQEESDHEELCYHKDKIIGKNKFKKKHNNFYSKEDSDDESEDAEILFMGTVTSDEESDKEGEVDPEAQYIDVVNGIEKCRRRNKVWKE